MTWKKEVKEIKKREKLSLNHGGKDSVKLQHKKGRKTLRERLEFILDRDSFDEVGKIEGRPGYNNHASGLGLQQLGDRYFKVFQNEVNNQ